MALFSFTKILNGLNLIPKSVSTVSQMGDIDVDSVDGKLNYNNGSSASPIVTEAHVATLTNKTIDANNNTILNIANANVASNAAIAYSKLNLTDSIKNSDVNSNAAIAYSKLNLAGDIVNSDINSAAAIAYSKLNLSNSIVNSDINSAASIALNKLAPLTANKALISDGSGVISPSVVSASELAFVSGVTSNIQTQLNSKQSTLTFPLTISQGGTNASTATVAFNNLSPTNAKGDLITNNGTNNVNFPVGLDGTVLTADSTQTSGLRWGSGGGGSSAQVNNFIINGNFDLFQRNSSFASLDGSSAPDGSPTFFADRFSYFSIDNTTAKVSAGSNALVPTFVQSNFFSINSGGINVTTSSSSLASGDFFAIRYAVEGYDFQSLFDQTVTLSFWVYATKTGTNSIYFTTKSREKSYVATYTVNSSNTWEKKNITLVVNPTSLSFVNYTNGLGLEIGWVLGSGSDYTQSTGSWATPPSGSVSSASGQVNNIDAVNNKFLLSQVSLTLGSNNVNFQRAGITIQKEIALCQRYFEKSYDLNIPIGFAGAAAEAGQRLSANFNFLNGTTYYKVTKRATDDTKIVSYSPITGASGTGVSGKARDYTSNTDVQNVIDSASAGENGFYASTGNISGDVVGFAWSVDMEL